MTCEYCTPNKHGQRKPLDTNYPMRLSIYRKRNKKKKYFIGCHSKIASNGVMYRNNGFLVKVEVNFCPMCGRDLRQVKKK